MKTKILLLALTVSAALPLTAGAYTYTELVDLFNSGYFDNYTPPNAGPFSGGRGDNAIDSGVPGFVGPDGAGVRSGNNYDNPAFVGWVTGVVDYRPINVGGKFNKIAAAIGPAYAGTPTTVTLGDMTAAQLAVYWADPVNSIYQPGSITLTFSNPIYNLSGGGADFVVFENGFASDYDIPATGGVKGGMFAELAYVEVSTDGITFARFPSLYLNTADNLNLQFDADGNPTNYNYGSQDPAYVYNLAGKHGNNYGISWGTPFDLDDLLDNEYVLSGVIDLNEINHVRLVDIPGNGSFTDSLGNPIYDAWLTYDSGGFDLDAIGVLHQISEPSTWALLFSGVALLFSVTAAFRRRLAPTAQSHNSPAQSAATGWVGIKRRGQGLKDRRIVTGECAGLTALNLLTDMAPSPSLRFGLGCYAVAPLALTAARRRRYLAAAAQPFFPKTTFTANDPVGR